jgi:hypothetical protein
MSKSSARNRNTVPSTVAPSTAVLIAVIAVAAFIAGAGVTWLIMREHGSSGSKQPPTFVVQGPGAAVEPSMAAPPDVSQLPPAQAAVTLGNWNYDHKNWSKAIELYQRAISLGMDIPDVRTDLGNAFRFSSDPRKALEQYQIAQRQNPQHENSFFNAATLYAQVLNEPVNAVRALQDYLRRFPNGDKAPMARQILQETDLRALSGGQASDAAQKPAAELP